MKNFLKIALSTAIFLSASASFAADVNDMLALESGFQQLSVGFQVPRLRAASAPATVTEEMERAIEREAGIRQANDDAHDRAIEEHEQKIGANERAIEREAGIRQANDDAHDRAIEEHEQKIGANERAIGDMNFTNTQYIKNDRDLSSAVRTLDANFAQMNNRLDDLDSKVEKHHKEMKRGFASLAAMTRLVPNAKSKCNTQLALGMGHYRGSTGVAVGLFHYVDDNTLINAGVGYAGQDSTTFGVGITFGF